MIQAFIVDAAMNVLQRITVPTVAILQQFPLEPGQEIIPFSEPGNIEDFQPERINGVTSFIPRVISATNLLRSSKLIKRTEIVEYRNALWNGVCSTPKGAVDCDELSRANIIGTVVIMRERVQAGLPLNNVSWTMADDTVVVHTPQEFRQLAIAVMQFVDDVQQTAKNLKQALIAASTVSEVNAINVQQAAWPQ